jgi:hypothetical protein
VTPAELVHASIVNARPQATSLTRVFMAIPSSRFPRLATICRSNDTAGSMKATTERSQP